MKNKRRLQKGKNQYIKIIENHINQNKKEYLVAILVFFIGIIIGTMLVNSSTQENKNEITGYISGFVDSIKNKEYGIDGKKLFIKSAWSNIKLALIIWIAGSTIIGIPVIYLSVIYKGLCIGYSVSSIFATLGKWKGIIFSTSTMLIQNLVAIPCVLALMVSSVKMYKSIIKERNKEIIKSEIYRHSIFSLLMTMGLVFSSFLEFIFTTTFFSDIICKFI